MVKGKIKDLTGQRFGKLVAIECIGTDRHKNAIWRCLCDCGNYKEAPSRALINGSPSSCGKCVKHGKFLSTDERKMHGGSSERLYLVWGGMRNRCYDKNRREYPNYGGRGIRVCDEWLYDYGAFRRWAYENGYDSDKPGSECSIDRIDVDGDYCPANCRWVPMDAQSYNKRCTKYVTYKGQRIPVSKAAEKCGVSYSTIISRLKRGWSDGDACCIPVRVMRNGNASTNLKS